MTETTNEPVGEGNPAQPPQIEFLYWEDCPSHEQALAMLREAMRDQDVEATIDVIRVDTWEQAEQLRFPGSPTIRINGADIVDDPSLPVGLTCRIYRRPDGKMAPLPRQEEIAAALRQATLEPQIAASGGAEVRVTTARGDSR